MLARLRSHLSYANVTATLAVFLALGGGAYAFTLPNNSVKSRHIKNGQVKTQDLHDNAVTGAKVNKRSLAGVTDTCPSPLTIRFGRICAGAPPNTRDWDASVAYCAGLGLRLPTVGEARTLAIRFDVPQVSSIGFFWTDGIYFDSPNFLVTVVSEDGAVDDQLPSQMHATVCVTDLSGR